MLNNVTTPAIISFNFSDYDICHNHLLNDEYTYTYITDNAAACPPQWIPWKLNQLSNSPWKNTLYVRYHPFEFTNSNFVILFDGSMEIQPGLYQILNKFITENYEICVSLSHQDGLKPRISNWYSSDRITLQEKNFLLQYLSDHHAAGYRGCVSAAFRIYKKSDAVIEYLNKCYDIITSGHDVIRLDEIVSTIELSKYNFNTLILTPDIYNGSVFKYYQHGTNKQILLPELHGNTFFNNKRCIPYHIEPEYHRAFTHETEAMCLTRYLDTESLKEWIDHHLNIGFDHIHIFDNESSYDCKSVCAEYGDKVTYEYVSGYARHYKLYDDYVNSDLCKSEWIMAIDDDEYMELNNAMCSSIAECIKWYSGKFPYDHMFAIRWKHLFPKKFHTECTGNILDYCTEENPDLAATFQPMGDRGVKTLVHRIGRIHYEEAEENPTGGHVPVHSLANGAKLFNGELITRCSCKQIPTQDNEPARLIHCRFKGYTWYKNKYLDVASPSFCYGNCSEKPYIKRYNFNQILDTLD